MNNFTFGPDCPSFYVPATSGALSSTPAGVASISGFSALNSATLMCEAYLALTASGAGGTVTATITEAVSATTVASVTIDMASQAETMVIGGAFTVPGSPPSHTTVAFQLAVSATIGEGGSVSIASSSSFLRVFRI